MIITGYKYNTEQEAQIARKDSTYINFSSKEIRFFKRNK